MSRKVQLSISEPSEIKRRKNNVRIKGIPEDNVDTRVKLEEILEVLKVNKEKKGIKSEHKVGSKSDNKTTAEEGQGVSTQSVRTYKNAGDHDARNYDGRTKRGQLEQDKVEVSKGGICCKN